MKGYANFKKALVLDLLFKNFQNKTWWFKNFKNFVQGAQELPQITLWCLGFARTTTNTQEIGKTEFQQYSKENSSNTLATWTLKQYKVRDFFFFCL